MSRDFKITALLTLFSALLFIPLTGRLHLFDWDEINFAESAREMLMTGDYLTVRIFFEPFWEKPPLFIWFQVLSMKIFGVNEFAARFPNAIAGIITLIILYKQGEKLKNENFGLIWALAYGVSLLPFLYFKSGIIDPWFNLFIFLGTINYIYAQESESNKFKYGRIILSALFIGLAVLTKGPVAILVFGLTAIVLLFSKRFKLFLRTGHVLTFAAVLVFVGGFWFILQIMNGNFQTVVDFFVYQIRLFKEKDAGHGGFPLYHFVILFFGVFPSSIFVIHAHKRNSKLNSLDYFRSTMLILFWVVLILFSIVKTKIVHYSSLCYFPMSFLAAYSIYGIIEDGKKVPKWIVWILGVIGSIIGVIAIGFPVFDRYKQWFIDSGMITHSFTVGNLQANAGWNGFEALIGVFTIAFIGLGIYKLRNQKLQTGFSWIAFSSLFFILSAVLFISPKVEKYSQNATIEFFKSFEHKDAYVQTLYKSYAKLFYPKVNNFERNHPFLIYWKENNEKFGTNKEKAFSNWLATQKIDKDAYFVIRVDKKQYFLNAYKNLKVMYEKNGYVFCVREAELDKDNLK